MKHITYKTQSVCSRSIDIDIEDEIKKLYKNVNDGEKVLVDVKGLYKVSELQASGMKYWRL